jgi:hypothetical protein
MSTWLGEALWKQSQVAFAYLQTPGYCNGRGCTQFPILVGETGSAYKEQSDKDWLRDFADFAFARVSDLLGAVLRHLFCSAGFVTCSWGSAVALVS